MQSHQIIGIALMLAGAADILVAQKVLPKRIKDGDASKIVILSTTLTGVGFLAGGAALFYGWISLGG